ncbi:MAG: GNAT family N-acetyltransferase [Ginsengibacter sp.]
MKPYPRIENSLSTSRLKLDILALEDYDFISSLVNTMGWIEYIGDRNVHSKNDAIAYINKILSTENLFYWVVRISETNTPIGIISFLKRSYLENFDIGFAFLPDHSGNGFAFEATKEILLMISKNAEFKLVLATTISSNEKSIKLLTKLGFSFEKEIQVENQKLAIYTNKLLL